MASSYVDSRQGIAIALANERGDALDRKLNYHRQIIRNLMSPINQDDPLLWGEINSLVNGKMLKSGEMHAISSKLPWVTEDYEETK